MISQKDVTILIKIRPAIKYNDITESSEEVTKANAAQKNTLTQRCGSISDVGPALCQRCGVVWLEEELGGCVAHGDQIGWSAGFVPLRRPLISHFLHFCSAQRIIYRKTGVLHSTDIKGPSIKFAMF